jgi:predicted lactoylglutathione lyase
MPQMIFVNIPVTDVARSRKFFEAVGYKINEQFSDHTAACVVVSETIFFMILNHERFQGFATKPLANPATSTAVMVALSQDDRVAVDRVIAAAVAAGGSEPKPATDMGFMYNRVFQDPDGNVFEAFWMDPSAVQG